MRVTGFEGRRHQGCARRHVRIWGSVLALAVSSCGDPSPGTRATVPGAGGDRVATEPPVPAEVLNGEFAGIFDDPVRLADGRYRGPPFVPGGAAGPELSLVRDIAARGDLDRDGADELAVLLSESSGASGTRMYLTVMKQDGEGWIQTGTVLLGDRVRVISLRIRNGALEASVLVHGPADPACCPALPLVRSWTVGEGGLAEVGRTPEKERPR